MQNNFSKLLTTEVIDIIIFGSTVKGNPNPRDTDIAILTLKEPSQELRELAYSTEYHITFINLKEELQNPSPILNTLLREGKSIKQKKSFSKIFGYEQETLISYELKNLTNSKKVMATNSIKNLVKEAKGEFLNKAIFTIPTNNEYIITKYLENKKIKFMKKHILIH